MRAGLALMVLGLLGGVAVLVALRRGAVPGSLMPWALVVFTLAVAGFAFLTPSVQALISRRTPADRQGEVLGVNQSASALARILGPVFGLSLYKLTPSHLLPYAFASGLLLLMLPLIPRIRRG